jgi:hypothetical protein
MIHYCAGLYSIIREPFSHFEIYTDSYLDVFERSTCYAIQCCIVVNKNSLKMYNKNQRVIESREEFGGKKMEVNNRWGIRNGDKALVKLGNLIKHWSSKFDGRISVGIIFFELVIENIVKLMISWEMWELRADVEFWSWGNYRIIIGYRVQTH